VEPESSSHGRALLGVAKGAGETQVPGRAKIKIARNGDVQNIVWTEKSKSIVFNNLAAKALKKVKRFPAFPASIQDTTLDLQYEFVTPGLKAPRRKLELLKSP